MLPESIHEIRQKIEGIRWNDLFTETDVVSIRHALSYLAFNMALNGVSSDIAYATAATWSNHVRGRKRYRRPQPQSEAIENAKEIWLKAKEAGILVLSVQRIRFAAPEFQTYFSFLYCTEHTLDLSLLRLIANSNFSEMWQFWIVLDQSVIAPLLSYVQLPYKRARFRAVKVFGFLKLAEAYPILLSILHDPFPSVRWQSAVALGELGNAQAALPLIQMLNDPIQEVRWQASEALGKLGAGAIDTLLPHLAIDSAEIAWRLRRAFQRIGQEVIEPLIKALSDDSPIVRRNTAFVFEVLRDERAVPSLIKLLKDPDNTVRLHAAKALNKQQSPSALIPLTNALNDSDSEIRRWATFALGSLGDPQAVKPVLTMLKDPVKWVRIAATSALRMLKDRRAVKPLIKALSDRQVAEAAALALGDLADDSAVQPLVAVLGQCGNAYNALNRFDNEIVVQSLLKAVNPANPQKYRYVLLALGDSRDPRAIPILLKALKDPRSEIRRAVPYRLAYFGDSRVFAALVNSLQDEDAEVRYLAASGLER
jgi:HEAT repeat protein